MIKTKFSTPSPPCEMSTGLRRWKRECVVVNVLGSEDHHMESECTTQTFMFRAQSIRSCTSKGVKIQLHGHFREYRHRDFVGDLSCVSCVITKFHVYSDVCKDTVFGWQPSPLVSYQYFWDLITGITGRNTDTCPQKRCCRVILDQNPKFCDHQVTCLVGGLWKVIVIFHGLVQGSPLILKMSTWRQHFLEVETSGP